MSRELDTKTLDNAARDYARNWLMDTVRHPVNPEFAPIAGKGWVLQSMENFHFEDEFKYVYAGMKEHLGQKAWKEFEDAAGNFFTPYDDGELAAVLKERLAVDLNGNPIPGQIGLVKREQIPIGWRVGPRGLPRLVKADVHIGESAEEAVFRVTKLHQDMGEVIFPLSQFPVTMALNTRISNEAALGACDYIVDRLDEGSAGGIIQIRSGAQPADPDTAATGTLLATLPLSDPAFGAAADANPGGRATANAITSDASADATGTAGYFRASASNDNAAPLDDHIDGEVGTAGADMNLNTTSIVSGATVSVSSWTVTMPES